MQSDLGRDYVVIPSLGVCHERSLVVLTLLVPLFPSLLSPLGHRWRVDSGDHIMDRSQLIHPEHLLLYRIQLRRELRMEGRRDGREEERRRII